MQAYLSQTKYSSPSTISALNSSFPPERDELNMPVITEKLTFWSTTLTETCRRKLLGDSQLSFDSYNIQHKFGDGGVFPLCLDDVLDHLKTSGKIVSPDTFENGWMKWTLDALSGLVFPKTGFTSQHSSFVIVELVNVSSTNAECDT
jgi:hypothetical protein